MARSSAYSEVLTDVGRKVGRSLIYKEKRTGPRTEPWGTPLRRRKGRLYELQIRTFERRSER